MAVLLSWRLLLLVYPPWVQMHCQQWKVSLTMPLDTSHVCLELCSLSLWNSYKIWGLRWQENFSCGCGWCVLGVFSRLFVVVNWEKGKKNSTVRMAYLFCYEIFLSWFLYFTNKFLCCGSNWWKYNADMSCFLHADVRFCTKGKHSIQRKERLVHFNHYRFKHFWKCECCWLLSEYSYSFAFDDKMLNSSTRQCSGHFKFGKTSGWLPGVNSISSWDFLFHRNIAGRGTPRQLRPMCPHKRRALPTTHTDTCTILFDPVLTRWHLGLIIGFR